MINMGNQCCAKFRFLKTVTGLKVWPSQGSHFYGHRRQMLIFRCNASNTLELKLSSVEILGNFSMSVELQD